MRLRILFVSDIHAAFSQMRKLKGEIRQEKLDFIICGGDNANINHPIEGRKPSNLDYENRGIADAEEVLLKLRDMFDCKVYFVPGNHDPRSYFLTSESSQDELSSFENIINLHQNHIRIADTNLVIFGCGGSTASTYRHQPEKVSEHPFPYDTEEELQKMISAVSRHQRTNPDDQLILLTHTGPAKVQTTIKMLNDGTMDCGSFTLSHYLHDNPENRRQILLSLHGHVHRCWGMCQLQTTTIINPGSLRDGRFAIISLTSSKDSYDEVVWEISDIQLKRLT